MVTYHCTVLHGFKRVSRRRCETQAGTFTCLRLKKKRKNNKKNPVAYFLDFFSILFFSRSSALKKCTPEENSWQTGGKIKSANTSDFFFSNLPSSASQTFG